MKSNSNFAMIKNRKKGQFLTGDDEFYGKRKYSSIEHMRYMSSMKEKRLKPVEMYDLNYNLINIFKNSKEASDETGIRRSYITDVCSGQQNTTHGYIFKYGN